MRAQTPVRDTQTPTENSTYQHTDARTHTRTLTHIMANADIARTPTPGVAVVDMAGPFVLLPPRRRGVTQRLSVPP